MSLFFFLLCFSILSAISKCVIVSSVSPFLRVRGRQEETSRYKRVARRKKEKKKQVPILTPFPKHTSRAILTLPKLTQWIWIEREDPGLVADFYSHSLFLSLSLSVSFSLFSLWVFFFYFLSSSLRSTNSQHHPLYHHYPGVICHMCKSTVLRVSVHPTGKVSGCRDVLPRSLARAGPKSIG